jgi:peptide/nickel transport system permease protein/oligopeptide transport system permease protein
MPIDDKALVEAGTEDMAPIGHHLETGGAPLDEVAAGPTGRDRTVWGDTWNRLRRNKLASAALIYLCVVSFLAVTGPLWVPQVLGDPLYVDTETIASLRFLGPSVAHPMGTDDLGRDILGRVIYGARVSLTVGIVATLISLFLGLILGALAGYYGGVIDSIVMRLTDVFLAFPYILFTILLISIMGMGFGSVLVAIGVLGWTTIARVLRSSILSIKQNDYVEAARAMGASDLRIMLRHILPNALAPIIVYATMSLGGVVLTEAALSFLGVGVQPPTPSWGRMLNESQNYLVSHAGLSIWPGIAIVLTVLAFVLLGDGLRDALDVKVSE